MLRRLFIQKLLKWISFVGVGSLFVAKTTRFNEKDIEQLFIEYINKPSDDTAINLYSALPLYKTYDDNRKQKIDRKYNEGLNVLEKHLASGSKSAIYLAFKLFSITYGGERSPLIWIIGPYIHINPSYFLASLKEHSHLVSKKKVLGNLGLDFVDNIILQDEEIEKRIQSLEKVIDPTLMKIRNECIGILIDQHHDVDDYLMEMSKRNS